MPSAHEITQLLQAWSGGDAQALERLTPLVYDEQHRTAQRYLARERPDHTLQPTALIDEVQVPHFRQVKQVPFSIIFQLTEYLPQLSAASSACQGSLEEAWEASILPLYDARPLNDRLLIIQNPRLPVHTQRSSRVQLKVAALAELHVT